MLRKSVRILTALGVVVAAAACGGDDPPSNKPPAFVLPPGKTLELVTVHVEPGILGTGQSQDGKLSLVIPTGALSQPTDITIGRLDPASRPKGVVGDVYVLGPAGTTFLKPVRLRLAHTEAGGALRPVHLDTGTSQYAVLDNWVYVDGTGKFAGDVRHLSSFGVSDGSGPGHSNDSAFTAVEEADEALAQHAIETARGLYEAAATADPNNLQAHFGAALTGLALLPEHAAVDDLLVTTCGEIPLDVQGLLFGDSGVLAHEIRDRQGSARLTIEKGPPGSTMTTIPFAPNSVRASVWIDDESTPPYVDLEIEVEDRHVDDLIGEIELYLDIDAEDAAWQNGGVITLGPMSNHWLHLWIDDGWDDSPNDRYVRFASGTMRVTTAGSADGEPVAIALENVLFERVEWDYGTGSETVLERILVNGTIDDVFYESFEPAPGSLPFDDLVYQAGPPEKSEPVQAFEQCGAGLTEPYLKGQLDLLTDEVARLRGHLDLVAAHPNANSFTWKLPLATVGNGIAIPIGIVEVHAARAMFFGASAINELLQVYRFINPATAVQDLIGTFNRYEEWCDVTCQVETTSVHDLDLGLLYAALDGYFLTPVAGSAFGAADVVPVKTNLEAAINAVIAGLNANPTAEVLFNFRGTGSEAAAADELIGFGNKLIASLSVDTALAETPEWILRVHTFFSNPFSATSILADPDMAAPDDWLWRHIPAVGSPDFTNAELSFNEKALFVILGDVISLPEFPADTIYCEYDNECPDLAHGGQDYWRCIGDEEVGVCSHNRNISCGSWSECDTVQSGSTCIWSSCAPRDPQLFNTDLVDEAYDGDPPTFVNQDLWNELSEGF